jgi:hypothetical protein
VLEKREATGHGAEATARLERRWGVVRFSKYAPGVQDVSFAVKTIEGGVFDAGSFVPRDSLPKDVAKFVIRVTSEDGRQFMF